MKISTKGRYGLRALVDMGAHMENGPIPLAAIAGRQNISLNYLEQVFGQMRRAGIIKSVKGPNGGYMLGKEARSITVREVLEVLEGPFSIVDAEDPKEQDKVKKAVHNLVWDEINRRVNDYLESRTLADLIKEYENLKKGGEIMYYI